MSRESRIFFLQAWAEQIMSSRADGSDLRVVLENTGPIPDGIEIDEESGHIYWTSMGQSKENDGAIYRCNTDGTNRVTLVAPGKTFTPKQLTLDLEARKIYWCDREGMRVMRCNTDGSRLQTLVQSGHTESDRLNHCNWCVGIALDKENGMLYWTQKGPSKGAQGRIFRAPIEPPKGVHPAERQDIELVFDRLPEPIDLAYYPPTQILYWTDRGEIPYGNTLNMAPVNLNNPMARPKILASKFHEAIGLTIDPANDRIFVADLLGGVYKVKMDCGSYEGVVQGPAGKKEVIHEDVGYLTGIAYAEVDVLDVKLVPSKPPAPAPAAGITQSTEDTFDALPQSPSKEPIQQRRRSRSFTSMQRPLNVPCQKSGSPSAFVRSTSRSPSSDSTSTEGPLVYDSGPPPRAFAKEAVDAIVRDTKHLRRRSRSYTSLQHHGISASTAASNPAALVNRAPVRPQPIVEDYSSSVSLDEDKVTPLPRVCSTPTPKQVRRRSRSFNFDERTDLSGPISLPSNAAFIRERIIPSIASPLPLEEEEESSVDPETTDYGEVRPCSMATLLGQQHSPPHIPSKDALQQLPTYHQMQPALEAARSQANMRANTIGAKPVPPIPRMLKTAQSQLDLRGPRTADPRMYAHPATPYYAYHSHYAPSESSLTPSTPPSPPLEKYKGDKSKSDKSKGWVRLSSLFRSSKAFKRTPAQQPAHPVPHHGYAPQMYLHSDHIPPHDLYGAPAHYYSAAPALHTAPEEYYYPPPTEGMYYTPLPHPRMYSSHFNTLPRLSRAPNQYYSGPVLRTPPDSQ